ncbi:MAG: glycoside hydrolase family 31 protein [Firmicutes bacterium]|jgi:alpha-glucosidase|nr:glycoside hydrolase family 31 protein [Bacillota bacterium]MDD4336206.1 glycoside hydrolase family 31 protein [Bacillota bacterium]MDD4792769.1 glycoside hydrolase family 31 protein [Bacillota bacterium]
MSRKGFAPLGPLLNLSINGHAVSVETATSSVDVSVIANDVVRVCMTRLEQAHPRLPQSFSVVEQEWPNSEVRIDEGSQSVTISTPAVVVEISKNPVRIGFYSPDGKLLCRDSAMQGMGWSEEGAGCYKTFDPHTHFYGFGERTGSLDKRGTAMTLWNTDDCPYTPDTDPLYMSIPFFIALSGGLAYGLFMDTAARSTFNMGKPHPMSNSSKIPPEPTGIPETPEDEYWFGTSQQRLDYYFFAGPAIPDVVRGYAKLTGHMKLPPLWALGYHQCRFSYCPDSQVLEVAEALRKADIPCDAIYLDIDYMDGFRVFTFEPEGFPRPRELMSRLADMGFKVVAIVDPGVKVDPDYWVYNEGRDRQCFVKKADGKDYTGTVWPGTVSYPDFARADVRSWWAGNHRVLFDAGVRGIWNDMNEPSNFATESKTMDDDALHGPLGEEVPHAYVHNAYGNLMSEATQEAFRKLLPGVRPFVISRAGCGGIQRNACVWTGDNSSWWEHLLMSIPMCLNLSLSGVSFVGADVGGFLFDSDPELVTRWTQLGAFIPLFRNHSAIWTVPQEPYTLGEPYTSICREFIKIRYRLIPYIYTLMKECADHGTPVMRPMVFEFPDDEKTHTMSDQFMLGPDIMVAPIYMPGADCRPVYFPRGDWTHLFNGVVVSSPGEPLLVSASLGEIPVFLRQGAIIPWGREMSYVGQHEQVLEIIDVFPKEGPWERTFSLYVDDGETLDYENGRSGLVEISCRTSDSGTARGLEVAVDTHEENFTCAMHVQTLRVWNVPEEPVEVRVDGELLPAVSNVCEVTGNGGKAGYFHDRAGRRLYVGIYNTSKDIKAIVSYR